MGTIMRPPNPRALGGADLYDRIKRRADAFAMGAKHANAFTVDGRPVIDDLPEPSHEHVQSVPSATPSAAERICTAIAAGEPVSYDACRCAYTLADGTTATAVELAEYCPYDPAGYPLG